MDQVTTLVDRERKRPRPLLPVKLRKLYDGNLQFPSPPQGRPYVISNFVSTVDGVVSYRIAGHAGGGTISGADPSDRFIMGLLRASADAVVVGSRTVHDVGPNASWIPSGTWPQGKEVFAHYRTKVLHKPEYPLVVIVSGSGKLDLDRAVFRTPGTLVVTTDKGQKDLVRAGADKLKSLQVKVLPGSAAKITPEAILRFLHREFGARLVLHEGGPTLLGEFLAEGLVDELFLTVAPQISGRLTHTDRPGLVLGVEFLPDTAPWLRLVSAKQKGDHIYLRYRVHHERSKRRDTDQ